jgi:4-cresol dehydrogenase (hydroxylating)
MNRIVDFDETLAYVTIEPGVTFEMLSRYLVGKRSRLTVGVTGSTLGSSPLANALERGLGFGPYGDRFAHVCALEVVLPTGACLHTGFGRFPRAHAAPLHRWGVGPHVDGLFTQSNLGIVTRMTVWLAAAPECQDVFMFMAREDKKLAAMIDAIRPLYASEVLKWPLKFVNDYRMLQSQFPVLPWNELRGRLPLRSPTVRRLVGAERHFAWTGVGRLLGFSKPDLRHRGAMLARALDGSAELLELARLEREAGAIQSEDLSLPYWRKHSAVPPHPDPDRDRCGLIWCAPVVPLVGKHVVAACRLIKKTLLAAGFEPMITMTVYDARAVHVVTPIVFDRDMAGEDARAQQCANRLLGALADKGYYPYRLGINTMDLLSRAIDDYDSVLATIKRALDPREILAPGRYDGRPTTRNGRTRSEPPVRGRSSSASRRAAGLGARKRR